MPRQMTFLDWMTLNYDLVEKQIEKCRNCGPYSPRTTCLFSLRREHLEKFHKQYNDEKKRELRLWKYWHKPLQEKNSRGVSPIEKN